MSKRLDKAALISNIFLVLSILFILYFSVIDNTTFLQHIDKEKNKLTTEFLIIWLIATILVTEVIFFSNFLIGNGGFNFNTSSLSHKIVSFIYGCGISITSISLLRLIKNLFKNTTAGDLKIVLEVLVIVAAIVVFFWGNVALKKKLESER